MAVLSFPAAAPERSLQQRLVALEHANRVRSHRALVKADLAAQRIGLQDVFADELCDTMKVIDVLLALPKVGRVKANKVLRKHAISPSKSVGGMSPRQRRELEIAVAAGGWRL